MTSSTKVRFARIIETTPGSPPTPAAMSRFRFVSDSFAGNLARTRSDEIRDDRQVDDVPVSDFDAPGGFAYRLHYGGYDDFEIRSLMQSTWAASATIDAASSTVAVTGATKTFTTSGTWDTTPAAGDWIKVAGFATAGNNGFKRVGSATSTTIVCDISVDTMADEAAGASVTFTRPSSISNGTTEASIFYERETVGVTSASFEAFLGYQISSMSMEVSRDGNGMVGGQFEAMGMKVQAPYAATQGNGSFNAAPTTPVFNSLGNLKAVMADGAVRRVRRFAFTAANDLRYRKVCGEAAQGSIESIGSGDFSLTGEVRVYWKAGTPVTDYAAYLNDSEAGWSQVMTDRLGNTYIIDLPSCVYTNGQKTTPGKTEDIMLSLGIEAKRHATLGYTMKIVKSPA